MSLELFIVIVFLCRCRRSNLNQNKNGDDCNGDGDQEVEDEWLDPGKISFFHSFARPDGFVDARPTTFFESCSASVRMFIR